MVDFILVGAGSAGCVLANRLSADGSATVAVLEAGGSDDRAQIRIPAAFSKLFRTDVDWDYWTTPQRHAGGRRLFWPRGKVLGGSSSINAMIYIRGHRADYDGWAEAGCTGWSYEQVLTYFKRSENNVRGASAYHGASGPLRVEDPRDPSVVTKAFVEAAVEAGYPHNDDFNGARQAGAGLYQLTQRGGRRVSAATAFLKPAMKRSNLRVETEAYVTRVLFRGTRATGVEYLQDGQRKRLHAAREVILCGGAVNSPQLLMLSGVGSAERLRTHGIPVVADRPGVGKNLHDHPIVGVRYRMGRPISLLAAESITSVARYLAFRRGMLSSNVAEAGLFISTREGEAVPDIQFHTAPVLFHDHGLTKPEEHGFSLGPTLVRPLSRGELHLHSPDPFEPPVIDPNYLAEDADVASLVAGVRVAREVAAQPALAPYCGDELTPGPEITSEDALADFVRETCETLYHPVGTCRMGTDAEAVVDPELRVNGLAGLRVVDASVMPTVPSGNTNAPTLMVAEKAADLIAATPTKALSTDDLPADVVAEDSLDAVG